jgi:hypothetical protein
MGRVTNSLIQNNGNSDQQPDVGYCSHHFGAGCWLQFLLFRIRLLITFPLFWIRLLVIVQNNGNSDQQADKK